VGDFGGQAAGGGHLFCLGLHLLAFPQRLLDLFTFVDNLIVYNDTTD